VDLSFDPLTFSGWAPLFPLQDVVLLPGALLPLHIFEPRYRAMLADALEGERLIAMALLKPNQDESSLESPEIFEWVGLGRIVAHAPLADGRSNLVLAGLRRAKVLAEDRSRAYRRGKLLVAEDAERDPEAEEVLALRSRVARVLEDLPDALVRDPVRLSVARRIAVPLGPFVDLAADTLQLTVAEKQALLEEARVAERAARLVSIVEGRAAQLRGSARWPPRFSRN
jgi:Lon protease-like protein